MKVATLSRARPPIQHAHHVLALWPPTASGPDASSSAQPRVGRAATHRCPAVRPPQSPACHGAPSPGRGGTGPRHVQYRSGSEGPRHRAVTSGALRERKAESWGKVSWRCRGGGGGLRLRACKAGPDWARGAGGFPELVEHQLPFGRGLSAVRARTTDRPTPPPRPRKRRCVTQKPCSQTVGRPDKKEWRCLLPHDRCR